MFLNVVIGKPLVDPMLLLASNQSDWKSNERDQTLFTNVRYLPAVLKEAGIVQSISEVIRNRQDLNITLKDPDCLWIKWGKKKLFVVVGE